jgi:cell division protein FtsQ
MITERSADGPDAAKAAPGPADQPGDGARAGGRPGGPWKAAFFAVAALAIVAIAVWALVGSSLLVVRSVTVTGNPGLPAAEVLQAAGVQRGTPLIRIDPAAVAARVERINQVQSAQVSRDWPDSVVITIKERTPALAVPYGTGFALVDRFGVVVSQVATPPAGMALLASPPANLASLRGRPAIQAAVTVLHQLPPRIRRLVRGVYAPSADAVTLDLRNGARVLWGGTGRASAKAAELTILMRTKASFYDVSDPDTAVTGG